ncbi:MAG: hypothetical protein B0D96_05160 [Candidatus Sedimenticola endophacoides]|uniref:Dehydrogenase n=1 Tax=Candidatus Sedimenticola endophacoides TaxID=2548426 RepID=A0A657Q6H7_9GAMM|nr:MAG: hypothetical protein B0D94_08640 [Candidatus Sedimenticola endophacoides]OQX32597.1 MAG: hypothetical protein B0D84_05920 [Candidatus Sedimenticola endophacoides]OQX36085.1 MAG: hypothetical protein B0D96_05160 [Candidatus Sedimenticola endophacoides]OQX40774.1 MAG: hypothetical protein B0D89_06390 [Candidatus Sedimenticola endophacoides]OQX44403.1 MAG: hypothetical protein B0D88_02515 [Candidatus Sedimenticola endophacoides]
MSDAPLTGKLAELTAAVKDDLGMLARLHDREADLMLLESLADAGFPDGIGLRLQSQDARDSADYFSKALARHAENPQHNIEELQVDYASIYLNHNYRASPYESVWTDDEGLERQEAMFQVREYYERHGLGVQNWNVRADDHLVNELLFLSHLFANAEREEDMREVADFLDEHPLRWTGEFAHRVAERCETAFYAGTALITSAYLQELRDLMADLFDLPRLSEEELEKRVGAQQREEPEPMSCGPEAGPTW